MDVTGIYIGLALIVAGVVLFTVGRRSRPRVKASNGSVAVGGSNNGSIVNINNSIAPLAHSGGHGWTIAAIIVETIGIGVTVWHAYHLVGR